MEIDPEVDGWSSTSALSWKDKSAVSRNNPQIWRLAEWLYEECCWGYHTEMHFGDRKGREDWYDKAAELLKKIENREFTGPDNHKD